MSTFEMYLALPNERKLHTIDAEGKETFKSIDEIRSLHLLHAQNQPPVDDESKDDQTQKDDEPDPRAVLESLELAKGELDVVRDLINNVKEQKYLAVETVPRPKNQVLLKELYTETAMKLGRKHAALERVTGRLRRGAAGLRAQSKREDAFFLELAKLQRFWKVQQNRQGDAPFTVDLSINKEMADLLPKGAAGVEIYKDADCNLRLQLPGGPQPPRLEAAAASSDATVVVGADAVHRLLLDRQQKLVALLLKNLLHKVVPTAGTNTYLLKVALMAISNPFPANADRDARSMQLLVRDFCQVTFWRSTMRAAVASSSIQPQKALDSAMALLRDFTSWQSHKAFRRYVLPHLERQAFQLNAAVHWTPSWTMSTSVYTVELLPGHLISVLIRENSVELEGVLSPLELRAPIALQPGLRTIHRSHMLMTVNSTEVARMLVDLLGGR